MLSQHFSVQVYKTPSEQQWMEQMDLETEITGICASKGLFKALLLPKPLLAAVALLETNLSYACWWLLGLFIC